MTKIISLVNQKGGVGKTTSAINLATYLAAEGKRALLVDLDPQSNASSGLGIDSARAGRNLYQGLILNYPMTKIIINTGNRNLDIIPASQDLAGAAIELADVENREYQLYKRLRELRSAYDYIIIDSPPSLGLLTINGLVASDEVIIPVQTEYFALEGLGQLLNTIDLVKENLQPQLRIGGVLLTMFDRRNRLAHQVVKEVRSHFPGYVFNAVIPRTVRLAEAPSFGQSIFNFDRFNKGAKAYRALARELIGKDINCSDLDINR
jgi:chromosome partitioning protein